MSLSASIPISIGLATSSGSSSVSGSSYNSTGAGSIGFGSFNIPLFVEWNIGNGATYSSDKDHGFVAGLGVEYVKNPIIGGASLEDDNKVKIEVPTSWIQPVAEVGYRYWNKNNKAREINLKYGSGFTDSSLPAEFTSDKITSSKTIKLTFLYLIGY
jgi:hypothetical protein